MSAVVGMFHLDRRPVEQADLERMQATVAHRGPDAQGTWSEGCAGLGHRMLWTTPESKREKLPLASDRGKLVLTADARVDNRDELAAALGLSRPLAEITDGELILAAYERWGERCPEYLQGDFAFGIWDRRKQVLFCARDRFGVKPLYFYSSTKTVAFSSEIKALLSVPDVPCRLNEVSVAYYLTSMFEDTASTFYLDIQRLPPAHSLTVSLQGTRLRCYWTLDPSRELRLGSDDEYAEGFRETFMEAVRCRLRSAYPVGSLLSGGLDSSAVTCVARNLLAQDENGHLATFSAIFDVGAHGRGEAVGDDDGGAPAHQRPEPL